MSSLPTKPKTAEERLQALARSASNDTRLVYNSGNWSISDIPVPADTRFVLYPDQVSHYWIHFAEGKVVQEIIALVAEDIDGDSELKIVKGKGREHLGGDDQSLWEKDNAGKARDPWTYGLGLPAMNAKTGAIVVFKIASVGGMGAIAGQVAAYTRNKHLGYPIVELSTGSYKNKKFGGFTSFPVFVNVGYDTPVEARGHGGEGAHVIGQNNVADVIEADEAVRIDREVDDDIYS
jgi:hypothetical protein